MYCDDCGTRLSDGVCPNCYEELFIVLTQGDDLPEDLSDEFVRKCSEQARVVQQKAKRG